MEYPQGAALDHPTVGQGPVQNTVSNWHSTHKGCHLPMGLCDVASGTRAAVQTCEPLVTRGIGMLSTNKRFTPPNLRVALH